MTVQSVVPNPDPSVEISSEIQPLAETLELTSVTNQRTFCGSALLVTATIRAQMLAMVQESDLTDARCRFLIEDIVRPMAAAGIPIDQVTVTNYVATNALLKPGTPRIQLETFLADLVTNTPSPTSGPWYGAQIVEESARRRVAEAAERLDEIAASGQLAELRDVVQAELFAVIAAVIRAEMFAATVAKVRTEQVIG